MNYFIRFSFISLLVVFLQGCSHTPEKLNAAEQLMDTHPDSALKLLRTIKPSLFISPAHKALYALLYSQAMDKNEIKLESDSLISIATGYYGASEPDRAGYAWFYKSRCANNRGDAKMQAEGLLKAQEYAEQTGNYKLRGLVYGDKGVMYKNQQQFDSSIHYHKLAYRTFGKINDNRNSMLGLLNTGANYLSVGGYDSALTYYNTAYRMAAKLNDSILLSTIYRTLGSIYLKEKKYNSAIHWYKKVPITHVAIYDSNKWLLLSDAFLKAGKPDSSEYYLDKMTLLNEMAPCYYQLRQSICEQKGQWGQALVYSKRVIVVTDSLNKRKLDISFAGLEKKYRYQTLQVANQQLIIKNKQNNILLLIALFLLSMGTAAILWWRNITKNRQLKVQKQLVEKEKENNILLENQLKFQKIILLNVEQHRKQSVKRPSESEVNTASADNYIFYEELIACMDLQYNNISKRLVARYSDLTERDILICCLLLANFDTGMIATILNVKLDSITKQRYRLRTRMGLQNTDNLITFLLQF